MPTTDRYLEPHQARVRPQTIYEELLGDALERAFGAGIDTLPGLVAALNDTGPAAQNGQPWTEASFEQTMAALGA